MVRSAKEEEDRFELDLRIGCGVAEGSELWDSVAPPEPGRDM